MYRLAILRKAAGNIALQKLRYIPEAPATNDELESHSRIASAIEVAITGSEPLRYVGLLGPWGSGKSSVAGMVEARLRKLDAKWVTFTFDAWAAQSDPQRRTFLEELRDKVLAVESSLQSDDSSKLWRKKIKRLAGKRDKIRTRTKPHISLPGALILGSLLLIPLGSRLVGDGYTASTYSPMTLEFAVLAIGWFLCLLPIALILLFSIGSKNPASFFLLAANKTVEDKSERRNQSIDPTSIEFREIFDLIIVSLRTKHRRLFITVDNLDRIPPNEAKSLWSSIHALFQGRESKKSDSPIVLIPIDDRSISGIYGDNDGSSDRGDGYIDKTFDVTFRVPLPVLSNWQRFLKSQLRYAFFDSLTSDELIGITSIVDSYTRDTSVVITPRWINKFVNRLVSVSLQSKDDGIGIFSRAYWSAARERVELEHIKSGKIDYLEYLDSSFRSNLAALYYGVTPFEARQILMQQELHAAVRERDDAALGTLSTIPGFGRNFVLMMEEVRGGVNLSPASIVWAMDAVSSQGGDWFGPALEQAALLFSVRTNGITAEYVEAIRILLTRLPASSAGPFRDHQLGQLSMMIDISSEIDAPFVQQALELLVAPSRDFEAANPSISIQSSAIFENLMALGLSSSLLEMLSYVGDEPTLADRVRSRLSGIGAAGGSNAIRSLRSKVSESFPWQQLAETARLVVERRDSISSHAVEALLELWVISPTAAQDIRIVAQNGALQQIVADESLPPEKAASGLALLIAAGEAPHISADHWERLLAQTDFKSTLDGHLERLPIVSWQELMRMLQSRLDFLPAARHLAHLLWNSPRSSVPTQDDLQSYQSEFARVFDADGFTGFWTMLSAQEFWEGKSFKQAVAIRPVLKVGFAKVPALATRVMELAGLAGTDLIARTVREGLPFSEPLIQASEYAEASGPVVESLQRTADELLHTNDEAFRQRWFALASSAAKPTRRTLYRTLIDKIAAGQQVEAPERLLSLSKGPLVAEVSSKARAGGMLRHVVIPILSDPGRYGWIMDNGPTVAKWIAAADTQSREAVIEQVKRRADAALAKELGIRL